MILLMFIATVIVCALLLMGLKKIKEKIGKVIYLIGVILINITVVASLAWGLFITATAQEMFQTLLMGFIAYLFFMFEKLSNNYDGSKEDYTDTY